jgi:hypothetical protein
MAVDNDEAVVPVIQKKRLSDPSEIGLLLLIQFDTGPDTRVDEQIISEPTGICEATQKFDMAFRDSPSNRLDRRAIGHE